MKSWRTTYNRSHPPQCVLPWIRWKKISCQEKEVWVLQIFPWIDYQATYCKDSKPWCHSMLIAQGSFIDDLPDLKNTKETIRKIKGWKLNILFTYMSTEQAFYPGRKFNLAHGKYMHINVPIWHNTTQVLAIKDTKTMKTEESSNKMSKGPFKLTLKLICKIQISHLVLNNIRPFLPRGQSAI